MKIDLDYGKCGLSVDFEDHWNITVMEPEHVPGVANEWKTVKSALQNPYDSSPLRNLVSEDSRVGIIFNDITRATPNHVILPAILDEIKHVPVENVTFFNALGTHRENSEEELRKIIPSQIVDNYRIVSNNCHDRETQSYVGKTIRGTDIYINAELMKCNTKILTGFIEPHFFAGFSGGGKAIMPGMAGLDTILRNHSARMIDDPYSTWGEIERNPIQQEIREIAEKVGADFIVNVTMNNDHAITGVFTGKLKSAHDAGCEFARGYAMKPVTEPFDIVVTTNSGYPLDQNLYQSVKGMSCAARVVKNGGAIIIASECCDGIPNHGLYKDLLMEASNPEDILNAVRQPGYYKQDQWEAQIQALVQQKADVYVCSSCLSSNLLESLMLQPCSDIKKTIEVLIEKYGPDTSICVLPQGPLTIPYIKIKK